MQSVGMGDEHVPALSRSMVTFAVADRIEIVVEAADDAGYYSALRSPQAVGQVLSARLLLHGAAVTLGSRLPAGGEPPALCPALPGALPVVPVFDRGHGGAGVPGIRPELDRLLPINEPIYGGWFVEQAGWAPLLLIGGTSLKDTVALSCPARDSAGRAFSHWALSGGALGTLSGADGVNASSPWGRDHLLHHHRHGGRDAEVYRHP